MFNILFRSAGVAQMLMRFEKLVHDWGRRGSCELENCSGGITFSRRCWFWWSRSLGKNNFPENKVFEKYWSKNIVRTYFFGTYFSKGKVQNYFFEKMGWGSTLVVGVGPEKIAPWFHPSFWNTFVVMKIVAVGAIEILLPRKVLTISRGCRFWGQIDHNYLLLHFVATFWIIFFSHILFFSRCAVTN